MITTRRWNTRALSASALLATAVLGLAACGGNAAGGPVAELPADADGSISINTGLSAASSAVELGIEQGFFDDEGLQIVLTSVESPSARVAAVQSGTVDVVELPATTWVKAVSQQVPVHALASENGYPSQGDATRYDYIDIFVGADSEVSSLADLGDARIAVPAREDLMEILVTSEIEAAGGDASDVEWIVLDFQSQVDALIAGRVDAIAVPAPLNLIAENAGARSIARPASGFFEQGPNSLWVVGDVLADDPELAERLQRAIYRSNVYANKHPDEVMDLAAGKRGLDPSVLKEAGLSVYFPPGLEVDDLERMAGKMTDLGFLDGEVDIADAVVAQPASAP